MCRESICRTALQVTEELHLLSTVPMLFSTMRVVPQQGAKPICSALEPNSGIPSCFPTLAAKCALPDGSLKFKAVLLHHVDSKTVANIFCFSWVCVAGE